MVKEGRNKKEITITTITLLLLLLSILIYPRK